MQLAFGMCMLLLMWTIALHEAQAAGGAEGIPADCPSSKRPSDEPSDVGGLLGSGSVLLS